MLQKAAWLLVLLALNFWYISANACTTKNRHRHPIVEAITKTHRRQANATSFIAITGVGGSGSDVPIHPRLEIRELERRPDEFNIFLLGLQRWMNVSQDDKKSYFQIAGREVSFTAHQRWRLNFPDITQVFTADLTSHGMASKHPRQQHWATVDTVATYFQHGIGLTWRW
jgi:hypothetical protein